LPAWWLEQALAAEGGVKPSAPLAGEQTADVAIVGGGFTGLWTALALRERDPSLRVTLLEAEICGAGPSGRNGGFLNGYWASLASTRGVLGDDDAVRLARAAGRDHPRRPRVRGWTARGLAASRRRHVDGLGCHRAGRRRRPNRRGGGRSWASRRGRRTLS